MLNLFKKLRVGNRMKRRNVEDQNEGNSPLMTMPNVVMKEIFGMLDFKEILKLRKVCRTLRNHIDENVNPHIYGVSVSNLDMTAQLAVSIVGKREYFDYMDEKKGCTIKWGLNRNEKKNKYFKKDNYLDHLFKDMLILTSFQKSCLEEFEIEFHLYNLNNPDLQNSRTA